jgi:hypothetical protein
MAILYTIGHSTRTFEAFVSASEAHSVQTLVDIRAFPMSRRLPHFNREALEHSLAVRGISYQWIQALGGYRKATRKDSPHTALRNANFRNYADYTLRRSSRMLRLTCFELRKAPALRTCALSAFTSVAIALSSPTGWWQMGTKCFTSMLRALPGHINSSMKPETSKSI